MEKKHRTLYDYWKYKRSSLTEFNNPIFQTLLGLVIFYLGLKMFSGGMKSLGKLEHMEFFLGNPAIIGLVASGALPLPSAIAAVLGANIGTTGTIWLAGILISDGMPVGITKQIAMIHTGVNMLMAILLLPFVQPIARFMGRF
jgi:hypothetical protein